MLRVLLRIKRVVLKIKEAVQLQIVIKKNNYSFTHCQNQMLINGQLNINQTTQFFIAKNNPSFCIETYLTMGQFRKFGGNININLQQYPININHIFTQMILNSPLNSSKMDIELLITNSDEPLRQQLISLHQLEQLQHRNYLKQINIQRQDLLAHKQELIDSIKNLREKNNNLNMYAMNIQEREQSQQSKHQLQMSKIKEQMSNIENSVIKEKQKVAEIVSIINGSGHEQVINAMDKIIGGEKISSSQ